MLLLGIITGLFILVLLVAVHELGHGIVARRNGVNVEEFGIGFPPKARGKKIKHSILGKNVLYTLNWLPLGGFVKLQGENDAADKPGDYGAASYWVKTKILLAGVAMNWIVAIVLFSCLAVVGLPKILPNQFTVAGDSTLVKQPLQVVKIESDSPADSAGLKTGDQILRLNGAAVASATDLSDATAANKGKAVELIYSRSGTEYMTKVNLRVEHSATQGYLGVVSGQREVLKSTWSAPLVGIGTTAQFTWETLKGTVGLIGNAAKGAVQSLSFNQSAREAGSKELSTVGSSVAGPVGILGVIFPQAQQAGLGQLIFLSAVISLSLAVMNTLPIPALDGGRWFTMTLFLLLKKPLTKEREEKIQTAGFLTLMALVLLVTVADVAKLF